MTSRALLSGLLAAALLALPHAAAASVEPPAPGVAVSQSGPKDYSRNAAGGDYATAIRRLAAGGEIRTSSLAGTTSPRPVVKRQAPGVDGRPLSAVVGFLAGFMVAGVAAAVTWRVRRVVV